MRYGKYMVGSDNEIDKRPLCGKRCALAKPKGINEILRHIFSEQFILHTNLWLFGCGMPFFLEIKLTE